MNNPIAYCGLDCEKCDAYIATQNDDWDLRAKVAEKWSAMNHVEIRPEMINCDGCRADGRRTYFCEAICKIRKCAEEKGRATCGGCGELDKCSKVAMILDHNEDARKNLMK